MAVRRDRLRLHRARAHGSHAQSARAARDARLTPRLPLAPPQVPRPPKRFAQAIGLLFSGSALIAELAGATPVAVVLIVGLLIAASLEAFLAVCLGCMVFQRLMRWGIIPASVCEACNDLTTRISSRAT